MSVDMLEPGIAVIRAPNAELLARRDLGVGARLVDQFLHAADDDHVKAIVLTGVGAAGNHGDRPPAVGADPSPGPGAVSRVYAGVRGLFQVVTYCKKVVVVEATGRCDAAGSLLCLAADFVVASDDSAFDSPFADLPEANYVLASLTMRANRAKSWMLRSEPMRAKDALAAGLVNEVVTASNVHDAALQTARHVRLMPLDGVTVSKLNVNAAFDAMGVGTEFDAAEIAITTAHGTGR